MAHMLFLQCPECDDVKPSKVSPRDFARLSIGVTEGGDLHIECVRHGTVIAHIPNHELGEELFRISSNTCKCEGHAKEASH